MHYFGFLARFVVVPLLILRFLLHKDRSRGENFSPELKSWPEDKVLLAHAAIAVAYTTVWDNYLVYSGIWSYDRKLVSGARIGYVPIEEYTFFILQPFLTGSFMLWLARRMQADAPSEQDALWPGRAAGTAALASVWAASMVGLWKGGQRRRYLSLITAWALPPIMLQVAFGGDILWRHRKIIAAAVIPASLYLGFADSRAIKAGTWRISPKKTVGVDVIPNLPFEEFLFFCLTNLVLVLGMVLFLSKESEKRLPESIRERYEQLKQKYIGGG